MEIYSEIDPLFLTTALRAAITTPDEDRERNRLQLQRWFPPVLVNSVNFEWMDKASLRTFTEAMPARAFDAEAPIKGREGLTKKSGQMIPFAEKYLITEFDKIQQMSAAAAGDAAAAQALDVLFADVDRGVRALNARMEIAYAEIIRLGTITISEFGVEPVVVDFGRDGANTSTAGTAWSDSANATPFVNERVAIDAMRDNHDLLWDDLVVLTNSSTYREYAATTAVQSAVQSVRVLPELGDTAINAMRRDLGMPDIVVYDAMARGVGASSGSKLIPDGDWLYVPKNSPVGATQFGTPAIAGQAGLEFELNQQPGPVAYVGRQIDPFGMMTVIDALGFPVAYDVNATYRLVV